MNQVYFEEKICCWGTSIFTTKLHNNFWKGESLTLLVHRLWLWSDRLGDWGHGMNIAEYVHTSTKKSISKESISTFCPKNGGEEEELFYRPTGGCNMFILCLQSLRRSDQSHTAIIRLCKARWFSGFCHDFLIFVISSSFLKFSWILNWFSLNDWRAKVRNKEIIQSIFLISDFSPSIIQ